MKDFRKQWWWLVSKEFAYRKCPYKQNFSPVRNSNVDVVNVLMLINQKMEKNAVKYRNSLRTLRFYMSEHYIHLNYRRQTFYWSSLIWGYCIMVKIIWKFLMLISLHAINLWGWDKKEKDRIQGIPCYLSSGFSRKIESIKHIPRKRFILRNWCTRL